MRKMPLHHFPQAVGKFPFSRLLGIARQPHKETIWAAFNVGHPTWRKLHLSVPSLHAENSPAPPASTFIVSLPRANASGIVAAPLMHFGGRAILSPLIEEMHAAGEDSPPIPT
jgi:hypothetical protein